MPDGSRGLAGSYPHSTCPNETEMKAIPVLHVTNPVLPRTFTAIVSAHAPVRLPKRKRQDRSSLPRHRSRRGRVAPVVVSWGQRGRQCGVCLH
jgi:hypothetical protein